MSNPNLTHAASGSQRLPVRAPVARDWTLARLADAVARNIDPERPLAIDGTFYGLLYEVRHAAR